MSLIRPLLLSGTLVAVAAPATRAQGVLPLDHLVIDHVTVIDVRDGRRLSDRLVVVAGGRIIAVTASAAGRVPADARVVDGRGAYLIPGLWDMHGHLPDDPSATDAILAQYMVNGVTGVRDMFGDRSALTARQAIARGTLLGPRLVVGSAIVDGPKPMWEGSVPVSSASDGRRVVDSLASQGYDFIKIYSFLSRAAYDGIAAESRRRRIPFAGHVPFTVSVGDASDAGQATLEHGLGLALACSAGEAPLRGALVRAAARVAEPFGAHTDLLSRSESDPIPSLSPAKCRRLFVRLVRNDTWVVPTLVMHRAHATALDAATRNDARLRYVAADVRGDWEGFAAHLPPALAERFRATYPAHLAMTRAMHRAGVRILAGSDAMNPFVIPGFALHDELGLLVDAGLTPLEALQSATRLPAIFLHASDSLGAVAPGMRADLVLLDADPLQDIRNVDRIRAVVVGGHYLDREALDAILTRLATGAGGAP